MPIPHFDLGVLRSISEILGHTSDGFTGAKIGEFLADCHIDDPYPVISTKRDRLFAALKDKQAADRCGNNVAAFHDHSHHLTAYGG